MLHAILHAATPHVDSFSPVAGDNLIAHPRYRTTRTIEINASPSAIYAWLVQLGAGRGGFYSFDRLEQLAGMKIQSADRIMPELQKLALGDRIPFSADRGPRVAILEPCSALVLHDVMDPFSARSVSRETARWLDWSWAFILQPIDASRTRLLVRTRADYRPHWRLRPLIALVMKPAHWVMERAMLRGIKQRAEAAPTR